MTQETTPLVHVPLPGGIHVPLPEDAPAVLVRDFAVPSHFGDPLREQRYLTESVGIVDRGNREVIEVSGVDRLTWLHSLTTQHLSGLAAGVATEALVLDPHGRIEHHLVLHDDGQRVVADLEPGTAEGLIAWLTSMRFLLRVEVQRLDLRVLTMAGPDAAKVLAAAGLPWAEPGLASVTDEVHVRGRRWPAEAVDLLVAGEQSAALAERLVAGGAHPAGLWAWEALRVGAHEARLGWETDHKTIPHEIGWLPVAVHLEKGCYRGQETVARVHNLGRPPRRLVLLHLDGSDVDLPSHGTPVTWEGVPVGFVGTAARHYDDGPVALAVIKRNTPDDAPLLAGAIAAAIDR